MADPLHTIIQAVQSRDYVMSAHYWETFVQEEARPLPAAIIASIGKDEPEIIESYPDDTRGASCLILGVNGQGNQIHSVVGYDCDPIRIITSYHPDTNKWINGRERR